ncbi:glycosyltransferase [Fibrobacter sp. UWB5]|uniref:glycosyltransferase n=1 Tax=Fibrobacter sp. UWB5 TaxID=1964360 RepID=UPI000B523DA9|nr:glycosyltransferase [Fibrobacter sp. UWB5]OWV14368.1 hypothetical protein B7989_02620 [Fibrobacter sp. UWB5]
MKRVLFILPTLTNGGAEKVASIIANALCTKFAVDFLLLENDNKECYFLNENIAIKNLGVRISHRGNKFLTVCAFFRSFLKQYIGVKSALKILKPDVVVSFLPKADLFAYLFKNKIGYKWISSERNDPTVRNAVERNVLEIIYRRCDTFVCQSSVVARYYEKRRVKNCIVIPNPICNLEENKIENVPYDDYMVAVGRFNEQKNYSLLVNAYSDALKEMSFKTKLVIVGDGPLWDNIKALITEKNLLEKVILLGRKNNVNDYLKKAKFFVLTSNYEGMPNVLIEAMSAGLPVVSTDFFTGVARELISDENGVVVPVGDRLELKKALLKMVGKKEEELKMMGTLGRKHLKHMDKESVCGLWEKIFA